MGGNLLSDAALHQVRELIRQESGRARGERTWYEPPLTKGPECFMAYASSGIDAMTSTTPGYADCDLYELASDGTLSALMLDGSTSNQRTVYNASASAVSAGYFPVWRDKLGTWWATAAGGFNSWWAFHSVKADQGPHTTNTVYAAALDSTVPAPTMATSYHQSVAFETLSGVGSCLKVVKQTRCLLFLSLWGIPSAGTTTRAQFVLWDGASSYTLPSGAHHWMKIGETYGDDTWYVHAWSAPVLALNKYLAIRFDTEGWSGSYYLNAAATILISPPMTTG